MRTFFIWLILGSCTAARALPPLELSGSTTVQGALQTKQAELEALLGRKIEFNATGSSVGLASLAAGQAGIAMISSPLEEIAGKLNAKMPGAIEPAQFRAAQIGWAKIAFIVNPRNRVRTLSAAQLAEMLTGKIKNWREVGGGDSAIVVVTLANGGPLIPDALLHGAPITAGARTVLNAAQIPGIVAQQPNAIGIISTAHVKGPTSLVKTDAEITVPLFLVTKGEPTADEQKLIDAARKLLDGAN